LLKALLRAAKRGVLISVTVDSYGTYFLPHHYIKALIRAGISFQIFEPQPRWVNGRPKLLRRLHRKFCVIDKKLAFIGGINLCEDHLTKDSSEGKRDFMACVQGESVSAMRELCLSMLPEPERHKFTDSACAMARSLNMDDEQLADVYFIHRDNRKQKSEIEKAYLHHINNAQQRVYIANAYFFPSNRVVRALKRAVKRGVDVMLIIQGKPDIPASLYLSRSLYKTLCRAGVKVYEFKDRPLHAKIAIFDDQWSTIGSSNLDPWSLGLNLEANIFIRSASHCEKISGYIDELYQRSEAVNIELLKRRTLKEIIFYTFIFHSLRWWPHFVSWVPGESLRIRQLREKSPKTLSKKSVTAHWLKVLADVDIDTETDFEIRDKIVS